MSRYFLSFIVAIFIHILLFIIFVTILSNIKKDPIKHPQKKEKRLKISLKEFRLEKKKSINKKKIVKKITKKHINKKVLQKSKKKVLQKSKKKVYKKVKKLPKKNIKHKKAKKAKLKTKPIIEPLLEPIKKEIVKKDPMSWLYEDKSQEELTQTPQPNINSNNINQNIKELYGDTFKKLSQSQQKYILDNQEIMRRITQQVLNRVASVNIKTRMDINENNIVEFYLYPNGDISDFKFLKKTGYFVLDDTSKETIEYAYQKYPRPKEKTLIRYNIFYNLK